MTGRDIALWVIGTMSALAVAAVAVAFAARRKWKAHREREALASVAVLALAVGVTCGWWSVIGWAWLLTGGTVR